MSKATKGNKADINAVSTAAADSGEAPALMEPLLIREAARAGLPDLALTLAQKSAGFRRSLPLEHTTRTAPVVTLEETELVEIDKAQFYILVRQNPHFSLQLMQLLSERLRNA